MSKKTKTISRLVSAEQYVVITINGQNVYTDIEISEMSVAKDFIDELEKQAKTIKKYLKS